MCGIVGLVGEVEERTVQAMNGLQIHRGPDDAGVYEDVRDQVRLAMRRLAIIDVTGGRQPMALPGEDHTIVFNGEIFNAPEIRRELLRAGRRFVTDHSDTEVLLHLYALEGENMLRRLNGMYAFVIHDRRRRRLFGARDPLGIKPLHIARNASHFAFASEIKSLQPIPWISWELDTTAVSDFFSSQAIPAPATIYQGVRKIQAGHFFTYDLQGHSFETRPFWQPDFTGDPSAVHADPRELTARVRDGLAAAVRRWSQSDVPVAISLSGGLDSTAVAAALTHAGGGVLESFTLGFADAPDIDERPLAAQVAARFGLRHNEIVIESTDLLEHLPRMLATLDEPYAGGLPSWFVFKAMAGRFKVAMTGSGGDELFGNYGKWRKFISRATHARHLLHAWRKRYATLAELTLAPYGSVHYPFATEGAKRRLLAAAIAGETRSTSQWLDRKLRDAPSQHWEDRVAWLDCQLQLPEEFLFMTDRFSMAFSIEARTPFLDLDFVRQIQAIPSAGRTSAAKPKALLLEAMRDWLPAEILNAPKRGFVLPMGSWLRGRLRPLLRELTSPAALRTQGIFQPDIGEKFIAPFLRGADHLTDLVWTIFMFQHWHAEGAFRR
jgi:asparagine synthase (glutamine-hydrolysing)